MRRFVVIGQTASASGEFSLEDLPGSSGRLDVLLRCIRAALLVSHGLRRDVLVYLVLQGGALGPRVLRVDGATAKFLRPDERSLATLVRKTLNAPPDADASGFREVRPGLSLASGGLSCVLAELGGASLYLLEEGAPDIRSADLSGSDMAFFLGDHLGLDPETRLALVALGAELVSVGPVSLHTDDAIAVVTNELDRAEQRRS